MVILLLTILLFLLYLIYEKIVLENRIKSIPLRISVTGTRGKSSVVRLIASILRESGKAVLAKTTGSEASYILPDGNEFEVPRRGIPTILEQKKLLKKATQLHVDCIVAEIMSIHPENHFVESQQLLKPNFVVLTNIRPDHIDAMGKTEEKIASVYCLDFPAETTLFIPAQEVRPAFLKRVEKNNIELIASQQRISSEQRKPDAKFNIAAFSENIDLAVSVARHLGVDDEAISRGIQKAKQDVGELKIWKYESTDLRKTCYLVNAFAANDPQSTLQILSFLKNRLPVGLNNFFGLLNLRADRGDRTIQWIEALNNGSSREFQKIFVMGAHTKAVKRKLKSVSIIEEQRPERMMNTILNEVEGQSVIFGFGNIGGAGRALVEYWNQIGEQYGI